MATRTVTFRFAPATDQPSWTQQHAIPAHVITASAQVQYQTISPIILGYRNEAIGKAGKTCVICNRPSTTVSMSPMFYLHLAEPVINVMVHLVCANTSCHRTVEVNMQKDMAVAEQARAMGEFHQCAVFGHTED